MRGCLVEGCGRKLKALGLCNRHWLQMNRHGRILPRTRYDPNEYIDCDTHIEIVIYCHEQEECGRVLIDRADVDLAKQFKWCFDPYGYAVNYSRRKPVILHRLIMGAKDGEEVDHIKCGIPHRHDCRRINMRIADHQRNAFNSSLHRDNKCGKKGVHWAKGKSRWVAQIMCSGQSYYLGSFRDRDAAAAAYDAKALELFGEFAHTNADIGAA